MKNGNRNSQTSFLQTTTSSFNATGRTNKRGLSRFGSSSRHYSAVGSFAPSLSRGHNVSQLLLNNPSAVTSTFSSLLEVDGEDEDGT